MSASFQTISVPIALQQEHRLVFTRDVFAVDNNTLAEVLVPRHAQRRAKVLAFWDEGVGEVWPEFAGAVERWFAARAERIELAAPSVKLRGGEAVKNDFAQLESVWSAIAAAGLCRHSYVLAIGGGAVLDLVGFAAATAHRGIPLVRVPTTSLSQGDGGVGVKNGVNFFGQKNWLGSFAVPSAVVNDVAFLHRLPERERRAGLIEAVKVALIRDREFFEWIETRVELLARFEPVAFEQAIATSARLHLEHIATAGDPFERGSARPLDFGHWAAHRLEQLSGFQLRHGEAVAIGMALDLVYARRMGLLAEAQAERILGVVRRLGFAVFTPLLEQRGPDGASEVWRGLEEFREHMGGRLTIPMIRAPGERVDLHTMELAGVEAAIAELKARFG